MRFYVEVVVAGTAAALGVLTVFWRDWIEALTGLDPDNHGGSVEWVIVSGLLLVAVLLGTAARIEWRRNAAPALDGPTA
jgi:hypothetical protein